MPDQLPLFKFEDMRPKLKKLVDPERVSQVKALWASGDQVAAMRMLREALEGLDRRLRNAKGE